MNDVTRISVTGDSGYDILVGRALLEQVGRSLPKSVAKVLVIHPTALAVSAGVLRDDLRGQGFEVLLAEVPDSEEAKRVEVAAFCWEVMGKSDFTRTDAVIGFGGGSTTDLAGFVAATWLRGVPLIQVPTTLLGMVDAAIGGKTGINTSEGKNLVGSFYAPSAVIVDLDTLLTLAKNEILAGFGEVVKYGFIADERILEIIPEAEQCISYGMPAFRLDGKILAGFAAFKNHCAYLPHSGSVISEIEELREFKSTQGSLHFEIDKPLSKKLLRELIRVRRAQALGK
mgnify:CR=1 FL=1